MRSTATRQRRTSSRALAGLGAALAALLLVAAAPPAAGAESLSEGLYGPSMRLTFADRDARLAGGGAAVSVRCVGPVRGSCIGTVTLRIGRVAHEVSFAVPGGRKQRLIVPLGARHGRLAKRRAPAVARTMQPLGSDRRQRRVLRLN
ncbi:MAG: hypothetical protein R2725_01315 [Solirubrobacterales bacterium]